MRATAVQNPPIAYNPDMGDSHSSIYALADHFCTSHRHKSRRIEMSSNSRVTLPTSIWSKDLLDDNTYPDRVIFPDATISIASGPAWGYKSLCYMLHDGTLHEITPDPERPGSEVYQPLGLSFQSNASGTGCPFSPEFTPNGRYGKWEVQGQLTYDSAQVEASDVNPNYRPAIYAPPGLNDSNDTGPVIVDGRSGQGRRPVESSDGALTVLRGQGWNRGG